MQNMVSLWECFVQVILGPFEGANIIDVAQAMASLIIAGATIVLWWATRNLADLTKKKPFVICTIESTPRSKTKLSLVIRNTGNAPAFDIEVSVEGKTSRGEPLFNSGISILAPNKGFLPTNATDLWVTPVELKIIVSWASKSNGKNRESMEYIIDYNDKNRVGWHEAGLDQIAEGMANN